MGGDPPARGADSGRRCAGLRPPGGAWGSGTSGHVQASSSAAGGTPDPQHTVSSLDGTRKPDKDILKHDWKPQVELWLLVLRDVLEEQWYSEAEIDVRVKEEPKAAETEAVADEGRPRAQGEGHRRQLGVRPTQALAHNSVGRTEENANTCISLFLRFLRKQPSTFSVTLPAHRVSSRDTGKTMVDASLDQLGDQCCTREQKLNSALLE